ncbi:uncharacterized protein EHS24_008962 [Apiotrichum porosum]|uniref:Transcription factor domain-containing protein n=1 Tax=Apiotrichum porosum TaxID=105984 RepID=A0A427XNC6_9TREE|nr:uncharacterized protein EHS24_008962 [Apiotrichum porosum]RSH80386.1 hypothetical protein EHS24_008962 [Apiotrichum porosum]
MHQPTFNGVALWRLVHKGVAGNWDKLIEIQGPYDECRGTQLILTSALGQIFAMMSGHPDLESTAHVFHGNGFRWAKLAGIFDLDLRERPLPSGVNEVETERAWAQWAARETQKRALLAHYIIDGLLMSMGDSGTSTKHMLNPFLVAADDHLFMASTAASWRTQYRSSSTSTTIADVYRDLFCPDERVIQLPPSSPFTAQTVLEGLHSLIMDLEESQALSSLPVGCVEMPDIARALDRFYQLYLDDAPNTLVLGARHADWFSLPCGRRALLHANAIRLVAARLPIAAADMPHFSLPVSLYDAAKVFLRHLASTALGSPNATAVRLEEPTDWALLGTTGLVSRPGPGGPDGRGADAATSGIRQGTIRSDAAGARVLSSDQWASFVENSGTFPVLVGFWA